MKRADEVPLWVTLGLHNIGTRRGAMRLVWFCVALTLASIPFSWLRGEWLWLGLMITLTAWYRLAVMWVDRHAAWQETRAGGG